MEENRAFENIEKWLPASWEVEGKFDTPIIRPLFELPKLDRFDRFCDIRRKGVTKSVGVQFFIQDYQFQRVWFRPDIYVKMLGKAGAVLSPDFSLYTDMPIVMSMYNHYRKHWCAAYWQQHGITVIPTIAWSNEASYEWCFDGEPVGGIVAVSSVGTQRQGEETRRLFRKGYDAMMERLRPETVLFWGAIPNGLKGNICPVEAVYNWDNRRRTKNDGG